MITGMIRIWLLFRYFLKDLLRIGGVSAVVVRSSMTVDRGPGRPGLQLLTVTVGPTLTPLSGFRYFCLVKALECINEATTNWSVLWIECMKALATVPSTPYPNRNVRFDVTENKKMAKIVGSYYPWKVGRTVTL